MTKAPSQRFSFFQRAQESIRGKYDLSNFFETTCKFSTNSEFPRELPFEIV